jgi:hypothetical protein
MPIDTEIWIFESHLLRSMTQMVNSTRRIL